MTGAPIVPLLDHRFDSRTSGRRRSWKKTPSCTPARSAGRISASAPIGGDVDWFFDEDVQAALCGGHAVLRVQARGAADSDQIEWVLEEAREVVVGSGAKGDASRAVRFRFSP